MTRARCSLSEALQGFGEHGDPILRPLAVADEDLVPPEVDVLDSERQTFHQTHARSVHQLGGQTFVALEFGQDGPHFVPAHDYGQAYRLLGADNLTQLSDRDSDNLPIKEEQRGERLVLGRGADFPVDGEAGEECVYLLFSEGGEGAALVPFEETANPFEVYLNRTGTVVA